MQKIDYRWLAGFFDGEGCIYIRPHKPSSNNKFSRPHSLQVSIGQKDRVILEKVKRLLGSGHVGRTQKGYYQYWAQERQAEKLLRKIRPYSQCKQIHIKYALQFQKNKKHECPLSKKEIKKREKYRQLIKACNRG